MRRDQIPDRIREQYDFPGWGHATGMNGLLPATMGDRFAVGDLGMDLAAVMAASRRAPRPRGRRATARNSVGRRSRTARADAWEQAVAGLTAGAEWRAAVAGLARGTTSGAGR